LRRRATLALAASVAILAGCGGGDDANDVGGLAWVAEPDVVAAPTGGTDRVVVGQIRNQGPETVRLVAERIDVRDADGRRLRSDGRFIDTFVHGLFSPADVPPGHQPLSERLRLGLAVVLEPDQTTPVFAAYDSGGFAEPLTLELGEATLPIPR
jgi:hypothetical protein